MKKTIITVTGANVSEEFLDKIEKFAQDPTKKSMVVCPKGNLGSKVDIGVHQIDVHQGFLKTLRHKVFGF